MYYDTLVFIKSRDWYFKRVSAVSIRSNRGSKMKKKEILEVMTGVLAE